MTGNAPSHHTLRVLQDPFGADAAGLRPVWDALLAREPHPTPFMRWDYLADLTLSGSATPQTGWEPLGFVLERPDGAQGVPQAVAACMVYIKSHSYGEYVFDWAWADAYHRHGQRYYPKALIAVPFTPVPGPRMLATDPHARAALLHAVQVWCAERGLSSAHLLFGDARDEAAAHGVGWLRRAGVQFHWRNREPEPYRDFDDFLSDLTQPKRKKIKQERRKVADAGVTFRTVAGLDLSAADWDFFYRCHAQTYAEHGGRAPYLTRGFFARQAAHMAEHWVMFIASRAGQDIACSLIAVDSMDTRPRSAYGRYWGALERVDCLHFEACYHQPIEWCIAQGIAHFEGGAQGEHKMARALLPTPTASSHWLAHPAFANAVAEFLARETDAIADYQASLDIRNPLRRTEGTPSGSA